MRYTFLIAVILLIFIGCSKDKFTTKPQLKYESVNSKEIHNGQNLIFRLHFTDAEGDISGADSSTLYVEKVSLNCSNQALPQNYLLPSLPPSSNIEGTLEVAYTYGVVDGQYPIAPESFSCDIDTCYFRFMLQDKAKNKSDTINSETIVLIK